MAMLRFDPYRSFGSITKRMSDIAGEMEKGVNFEFGGFSPRMDILEDEKSVYIKFEIPGVAKEDVKLSVSEENVLTLKGKKQRPEGDQEVCCIRNERMFGDFSRQIQLTDKVNRESVSASFNNGILELKIDKIEPEKPKEIEINIA